MSIAEMKLIAINEITKLEDESAVKEILDHLEKISMEEATSKTYNLFQHFDKVKEKYGDVLQKLAQ
jgi:hypothetical protein